MNTPWKWSKLGNASCRLGSLQVWYIPTYRHDKTGESSRVWVESIGFASQSGVDTQFYTHDLIKEYDWSDHPSTKKKKKKFLHHMHHFVLASHVSICSCIVCINSFTAYHKNDLEILMVAIVFSISKSNHWIKRYSMIKFTRSICIVSR